MVVLPALRGRDKVKLVILNYITIVANFVKLQNNPKIAEEGMFCEWEYWEGMSNPVFFLLPNARSTKEPRLVT